MTSPSAGETGLIFTAFQERKAGRRRWWWLAALPVLGLGGWAVTRDQAGSLQVVTPHGIKTVRHGMSPRHVQGILGMPVTLERSGDGRADCYRYGTPTLEKNFPVYSICFEDGELREVKVRQYEAWDLDPEKMPLVVGGVETPAPAPVAPPGG